MSPFTTREVSDLDEMRRIVTLFGSIWGGGRPPVSTELLRALSKAGNYVAGAFSGPDLVGACVAFFHEPAERALHSHVAGVSAQAAGRGVGYRLKQHQRSWALERGVGHIDWTFDPLIARNAHFNLVKLGARAVEYLPNFYGPMVDDINGTDESDRLLVRWTLEPAERAPGPPEGKRVAVPEDIELLRRTDPGLAREWRLRVREQLLGDGQIQGFDRNGGYIVQGGVTA